MYQSCLHKHKTIIAFLVLKLGENVNCNNCIKNLNKTWFTKIDGLGGFGILWLLWQSDPRLVFIPCTTTWWSDLWLVSILPTTSWQSDLPLVLIFPQPRDCLTFDLNLFSHNYMAVWPLTCTQFSPQPHECLTFDLYSFFPTSMHTLLSCSRII